jgi:curved DNA-binding protein CbpA
MECHPDRHGGDAAKADQFKRLVEAFNVLSDPVKRRDYDAELGATLGRQSRNGPAFDMGFAPEDERAILDTMADDILEELIVGNNLSHKETTLATLMLDLEQTEQFCLFREAKTHLYNGRTIAGETLFKQYLERSPFNILAHVFLSRCCRANGNWREAERLLSQAIRIGHSRTPPLQLYRLQKELAALRKKQPGFLGLVKRLLQPPVPKPDALPSEEQERRALNRAINRLALERERRKRMLNE